MPILPGSTRAAEYGPQFAARPRRACRHQAFRRIVQTARPPAVKPNWAKRQDELDRKQAKARPAVDPAQPLRFPKRRSGRRFPRQRDGCFTRRRFLRPASPRSCGRTAEAVRAAPAAAGGKAGANRQGCGRYAGPGRYRTLYRHAVKTLADRHTGVYPRGLSAACSCIARFMNQYMGLQRRNASRSTSTRAWL